MRRRNISIEEQILYEDKEILVCRKLPGIPVQSGRVGIPDMENAVKSYLVKKGESAYLGIIHRLDQPVQGVVVFAKNQKAAGELSRQIRQGEMEKIYLAAVEKIPDQTQGRLEDELEKLPGTNLSRVADRKTSSSKKSCSGIQSAEDPGGKGASGDTSLYRKTSSDQSAAFSCRIPHLR